MQQENVPKSNIIFKNTFSSKCLTCKSNVDTDNQSDTIIIFLNSFFYFLF